MRQCGQYKLASALVNLLVICGRFLKISNHSASGQDIYGHAQSGKAKPARDLCGRCEWVGADGLVVAPPKFNDINQINFEQEFYTSDDAADMCGNGSRAVCTRMRFGCTKCEILGGAGVISGEIFRFFGKNFNESVRGELHNVFP